VCPHHLYFGGGYYGDVLGGLGEEIGVPGGGDLQVILFLIHLKGLKVFGDRQGRQLQGEEDKEEGG
jgi:hypothetical protein